MEEMPNYRFEIILGANVMKGTRLGTKDGGSGWEREVSARWKLWQLKI